MSDSGLDLSLDFDSLWTGRIDAGEEAALATRLHQVIRPLGECGDTLGVVLFGFCSDEGVRRNLGRPGARLAPDAIRRQLANLPWSPQRPAWDGGNVVCADGKLEAAQQALADRVGACLDAGHFPVVLGGGHEVAFGSWLGLAQHLGALGSEPRVGIINFDAHFDLRPDSDGCSSGTSFYQIARRCDEKGWDFRYCCLGVSAASNTAALFRRADDLGVSYRRDREMGLDRLDETLQQLERFMANCDLLYLTIDLDVLPACVAPGVSAPAARGVGLDILEPLIDAIRLSGKLRLADIAEYNPAYDIDAWTARVAARLFHTLFDRGPTP